MKTNSNFIFGLDGILVVSRIKFYAKAISIVLKNKCNIHLGIEVIVELLSRVSPVQVFKETAPGHNIKSLDHNMWKAMQYLLDKYPVECPPGMYHLVSTLRHKMLDIAVASSAPVGWVENCLKKAYPFQQATILPLYGMFADGGIYSAEDYDESGLFTNILRKARHNFPCSTTDLMNITYYVCNSRDHVLLGLHSRCYVLYLSENDKYFDECSLKYDYRVKRFKTTSELSSYIIRNLI